MKRTALIVVGWIALAVRASAQVDNYTCYKTKDLRTPRFAGSTADSVIDEFGSQADAEKKLFLYCTPVSANGDAILNPTKLKCYKVKGSGSAPDSNDAGSDPVGSAGQAVKRKTFVLCVPATPLWAPDKGTS